MADAVIGVKFGEKEIPNRNNELRIDYSFNGYDFETKTYLIYVLRRLKKYLGATDIIEYEVKDTHIKIEYWITKK